jgi:3-isopropylmalate dehydrogenase
MLPSASLGDNKRGLFEPIHGSAPDIAGRGLANPCGMIASCALLLRYSLDLPDEATALEAAIDTAIAGGARTADLAMAGQQCLSTAEMTAAVLQAI